MAPIRAWSSNSYKFGVWILEYECGLCNDVPTNMKMKYGYGVCNDAPEPRQRDWYSSIGILCIFYSNDSCLRRKIDTQPWKYPRGRPEPHTRRVRHRVITRARNRPEQINGSHGRARAAHKHLRHPSYSINDDRPKDREERIIWAQQAVQQHITRPARSCDPNPKFSKIECATKQAKILWKLSRMMSLNWTSMWPRTSSLNLCVVGSRARIRRWAQSAAHPREREREGMQSPVYDTCSDTLYPGIKSRVSLASAPPPVKSYKKGQMRFVTLNIYT